MLFGSFTLLEVLNVVATFPRVVLVEVRYGVWKLVEFLFVRGVTGRELTFELRRSGCRFQIGMWGDIWPVVEVFVLDEYRPVAAPLPDRPVIVDVGAHIGGFAVWISRQHPGSAIYSYEPHPGSFSRLKANLEMNGVPNAHPFQRAVTGQPGRQLIDAGQAFSTLYETRPDDGSAGEEEIAVEGITLDGIFESNGLARCHILKMDCEGAEFDILFHTAEETFAAIDCIIMEYHDNRTEHAHPELVELLEEQGFEVSVEPNPRVRHVGSLLARRNGRGV